ncbi:FecCD family ABC transporter permease [Afifella marina]|uniref:Iron complex transport system permease protein n=1 Tax=Afifella marina DSM 2698 TaxID=1120955 RepID=A0A1G5M8X0_AFIMA|nr:iron ABC transporter permease [Afifella marina]MBK1622849.1 iron ABC transporter permease [Afifella marina DSM 2698]MBK1625844.1 iron ABC transporter permease [Afifella marina]MBK5917666.1 ABC transporter permease [Afifella marina]RAI23589.1 ABC transporter permease [Afifella marina DSM 2698]SCZ21254.1 iron complex transport system permease protein [Afifella marina DSM 2698]
MSEIALQATGSAAGYRRLLGILSLTLLVAFVLSLAIGYGPFDFGAALHSALSGKDDLGALVFIEIRLPRAILGLFVGFALGLAGAVMQAFLRNPLAEPGIIGISGAAAFGAVVIFYSGLAAVSSLLLPIGGIVAALAAGLLLFAVAGRNANTATLILAGIAVNSLAGALVSLVLNLSPNPFAATEIMFWLMGSFADRSLTHVAIALPPIVAGCIALFLTSRALDALALGEDTATSLGFDLRITRALLVGGVALAVGGAVAVSGTIGFVGLVVPHLLRPFVAYRPSLLLPASALGGAILTLSADIAVRLLPTQPELKLGVVTAVIGAPFLFSLVWRMRGDLR